MNLDEARARMRKKKCSRTRRQVMGDHTRQARGDARYRRALEMSAEGMAKADVARALGICERSLNGLLYRRLGSSAWPIGEKS